MCDKPPALVPSPGLTLLALMRALDCMNVSLTKRQKQYVEQKVKSGHYASASEVVREALRVLEDIETDREQLEALLTEADLEPALPGGKPFWKKLRGELKARTVRPRAA